MARIPENVKLFSKVDIVVCSMGYRKKCKRHSRREHISTASVQYVWGWTRGSGLGLASLALARHGAASLFAVCGVFPPVPLCVQREFGKDLIFFGSARSLARARVSFA